MTFNPTIPGGGLIGWLFLQRTEERQKEAFNQSPQLQRDEVYFRENIDQVKTAEDLVSDRRLLSVSLTAFGLGDDLDNRFFIQKILEGGSTDSDALASRLGDPRYGEISEAFGFGPDEPLAISQPGFTDRIVNLYREQQFQLAVGEQDADTRVALNAEIELPELAAKDSTPEAKWFSVLGNPPLRRVFETAYDLPSSFGTLDIDRQVEILRDRTRAAFGEEGIGQFAQEDKTQDLLSRFFLQAQVSQISVASSGQTALALLRGF